MKIALDLRWIRSEHIDGIGRYTLNLVSHLLQQDPENEYLCIGHKPLLEQHLSVSDYSRAEIVSIPQHLLSLKDFLQTQRSIERLNVDIFHVPNYLSSPFGGKYVKILTVFDLIPFLFPAALSKSRLLWRCFYKTPYPARYILRSADIIVTSSEHTKQDLIRVLNISADRIQVIWGGIEARFHAGYSIPESFWTRYGLKRNFLLYVGRQDPYKGLNFLVEAFARLPKTLRNSYQVVIAGKTDSRYIGDVHALLDRHQLHDAFRFLDYVPDTELPLLYSAATLLVHPSLYEGFGLPPLESMACGTPVVYADTSSLSDVLGDAGLAVLPASSESLAEGMRRLLECEGLRQQYIARGLQHSGHYSWKRVAAEMLNIYAKSRTLQQLKE